LLSEQSDSRNGKIELQTANVDLQDKLDNASNQLK
jgi:hypothetical protein